jgi:hypothetical protein
MDTIRQRSVLQAILFATLAEHPDGLPIEEAYDAIDQSYRFPNEWYRQLPSAAAGYAQLERLGITDWRMVPQEQLIELVATEPQWQNEIRWARNDLRKLGHLDTSAPRGVWRLTSTGKRAARSAATQGLSPEEQRIVRSRQAPSSKRKPDEEQAGGGVRHDLQMRLRLLTDSMPLGDLQLLVDLARTVRMRSLPEADEPPPGNR